MRHKTKQEKIQDLVSWMGSIPSHLRGRDGLPKSQLDASTGRKLERLQEWWYMTMIPVTQEAVHRRIAIQAVLGKKLEK
jgi:siroheme synthase (precorrin-2 oxidase/ferrochelatase)